jgi:hypothetical protein
VSIDLFHAVYHVFYMIIDFKTSVSSVGAKSHKDWLQFGAVARLELSATATGILRSFCNCNWNFIPWEDF